MSISTLTTGLDFLLTIICFYIAFIFSIRAYRGTDLMLACFGGALWAAGGFFGIQFLVSYAEMSNSILETLQGINNWLNIIAIAAVYSGLMHIIRNEKPAVARFPVIFTALPLLIVVTYPLSHSANAIYNWLIRIYQGGALGVAMIIIGYTGIAKDEFQGFLISAFFTLLGSYFLHWFLTDIDWLPEGMWQLLLAAGLILVYLAFRREEK